VGNLIDSSILIAAERGRLDLAEHLERRLDDRFAIAAITLSEALHGVHRLQGVRQVRARALLDRWLQQLPVVPFGRPVAETHAVLGADLAGRGETMGAHDLQIAATAVHLGYDVVTRDRRSFARLADLPVQYW
jgi:predicted nucleic acid-binding protein|tara:strand:- start:217 stop:615 length:399 start_codon:yes stop_codon:yes gene_type:complete